MHNHLLAGSLSALNSGAIAVDTTTLARSGAHLGGTVRVSTPDGGMQTERIGAVMTPADDIPMS